MPLEKKPFVNYTIGEKNPLEKGKIITVRLSPEEYKKLMYFSKILHISRDSTILKQLANVGQNVLISTFGGDFLKWLTDDKRIVNDTKLDNIIVENKENVTQNQRDL